MKLATVVNPHLPGPHSPVPDFLTGAAYAMLAVLGAILGVVGSFEFSWEAGSVPVAAIIWPAVNFAAFRGAGWAMGNRLGAVMPAALWLAVVLVLSARRPEGDLIVTGTTAGYLYLFGGMAAALVAISQAGSARPWTPGGAGLVPDVRRSRREKDRPVTSR